MGVSSAVVSSAALNSVEANRTGSAATSDLTGQASPTQIGKLADAIASGAGTKVTAVVPEPMRAALAHVARGATASGLNSVLIVGALACAVATVITVVLIGTDKNRAAVHRSGSESQPEPAL